MEPQTPAANRVRHILQAMERSIDTARSRRTNVAGGAERNTSGTYNATSPAHRDVGTGAGGAGGPSAAQHSSVLERQIGVDRAAQPPYAATSQSTRDVKYEHPQGRGPAQQGNMTLIGGGHASANHVAASQPQAQSPSGRLKAKPKRFEGLFNAQQPSQAQNPEQHYRSQTG